MGIVSQRPGGDPQVGVQAGQRGQVWVDVAVMLTAGGEAIADIEALRHQSGLFGPGRVGADGVAGVG